MIQDRNIFIHNLYYMLSYAFQSLHQETYEDVNKEEFDEMYDLLTAILSKGIGVQLKKGLHREYVGCREEIPMTRGKINFVATIKNISSRKKILTCDFDELSENNLFNQILKTTAMLLLKNTMIKSKYRDALKKKMLFFSNIVTLEPKSIRWDLVRFQKNTQSYRILIGICQLILEGMLMTTHTGDYQLASFFDEQRMCRLYEKFLLEYYKRHFPELKVTAKQIPWVLDDEMQTMLPVMQTDIHLEKGNTVLIIDAKYYHHTTQKYFDKNTVHSGNLYQMFAYVKNKAYSFGKEQHKVSGMILYAKTEEEVQPDCVYQMHGNQISVKTLDLNLPFQKIQEQLYDIIKNHFYPDTEEVKI